MSVPRKPGHRVKDPVPVAPLRDCFVERLGRGVLSVCDVAEFAGFVDRSGRPGTSQLQRRLGLRPESTCRKKGKLYVSPPHEFINYEVAVRIVRAMGLDPIDVRDEDGDPLL